MKTLLHVGCGSKVNKVPNEFHSYKEIRLDASRMVEPDIVASIIAMPMIEGESHDAIFASHVLEHLFAHEVAQACSEFFRILKPGGVVRVHVPDLASIGSLLSLDQADMSLYTSAIGHITPLDMIYGHRGSTGAGNTFMAHKTGFTASVLKRYFRAAGFDNIKDDRDTKYELKVWAYKPEVVNA